jgi:hypothetical protein
VIDTKAAYEPDVPNGPGKCQGRALVQTFLPDQVEEMYIFGRWWEGSHQRFNLVKFGQGTFTRVLRGWHGDYVEVVSNDPLS